MYMNEDISSTQSEIIDVLREGRATPKHLCDEVDGIESQQQAYYQLRQLRALRVVKKINRGLYELDSEYERSHTSAGDDDE